MSFEQFPSPHSDLDAIERFPNNTSADIAGAIVRGFERLEERLDATEACLTARLAELEDRMAENFTPVMG